MTDLLYGLAICGVASIIIGVINGAVFHIQMIIGMMLGALYSYTDYDDSREHTLQVCIFFISITIQWQETYSG